MGRKQIEENKNKMRKQTEIYESALRETYMNNIYYAVYTCTKINIVLILFCCSHSALPISLSLALPFKCSAFDCETEIIIRFALFRKLPPLSSPSLYSQIVFLLRYVMNKVIRT